MLVRGAIAGLAAALSILGFATASAGESRIAATLTTVSSGRSKIVTMRPDGSDVFTVTHGSFDHFPAWAPGRRRIAFVRNFRLFTVKADGHGLRRLTSGSDSESSPSWSPNGRLIAFDRADREDPELDRSLYDIFVVRPNGSGLRRLTHGEPYSTDPTWSPDGRSIAFTRGRNEGRQYLYTMRADGTHLRRLSDVATINPAWSPDGRYIVTDFLYLVRVRDGKTTRIDNVPEDEGGEPTWSADSRRVVFIMRPPGSGQSGIYSIKTDGHGLHRIAPDPSGHYYEEPAWY
jgi:TolB protein